MNFIDKLLFLHERLSSVWWIKAVYFLGFVFVLYLLFEFILRRILKKLNEVAKKTETELDDFAVEVLEKLRWPVFLMILLGVSYVFLDWGEIYKTGIRYFLLIYMIYEAIQIAIRSVDFFGDKFIEKKFKGVPAPQVEMVKMVLKIVIWITGILLVLSNLGYNVTSLITGLGIGGIAVALAVQNILGDLFSSFSIYMDKPFRVGDFVVVGDKSGTVKKIGIKTTRMLTLEGDELVIPNQTLVTTAVQNFGRMKRRRVAFTLGVVYGTPMAKLKKIPDLVREIIDEIEGIDFDRAHFKKFGESSLDFEIVYYVNTRDYLTYMNMQENLNLQITRVFENHGLDIAYPTQTIFLKKN